MKSIWIRHKGAPIFYADYAAFGRDVAKLRAEVDAVDEVLIKQPNSLLLVDIRNTVTSSEVVVLMKESAVRTKGFVAKTAVVGVTGIQRVLAGAVARFSREPLMLFGTVEEAKEWLAGGQVEGHEILPGPD